MSAIDRILAIVLPSPRWRVVTYAAEEHWYYVQCKVWWWPRWIRRGSCIGYLSKGEANRVMQALSGFTPVERVVSTASEVNADAAVNERWGAVDRGLPKGTPP